MPLRGRSIVLWRRPIEVEQGIGFRQAFIKLVTRWSARDGVRDSVERGPNVGGQGRGRSAGWRRDAARLDSGVSIRVNSNDNARAASDRVSKVREVERSIRNNPTGALQGLREEAYGASVMVGVDKCDEH